MNRNLFFVLLVLLLAGLLLTPACKTGSDTSSYTLTVTMGDGISGAPAAGSSSHEEGDTVSYNYTAQTGYGNLTVTLDGTPVANAGVITMTANHTLAATADIDIRGQWTGTIFGFWSSDCYFEVTFSGGILSGTTHGSFDCRSGFGNGEYTIENGQIEFELRYNYSGIIVPLSCSASFTDVDHIDGEFYWPDCGGCSGTFQLVRE